MQWGLFRITVDVRSLALLCSSGGLSPAPVAKKPANSKDAEVKGTGFSPYVCAAKSSGALQAAGVRPQLDKKRQGTTSVVPQMRQNELWALAPKGCIAEGSLANAACKAVAGTKLSDETLPRGLKPVSPIGRLAARLKSCPFKPGQTNAWTGLSAACFAAVMLLRGALGGLALEPSTPLQNYGRQSWVMENGLPQNTVQAMAQTKDGFIWLGTEVGLVRFDGNSFQVFDLNSSPALPGNDVRCLLETKDGALWIGTSEGLARWKNGALTTFTSKDGLPGNDIRALVESGYLWVWTDQGLARFTDEERFVDSSAKTGVPTGAITAVTTSGNGGMWVMTHESAVSYAEGHWGSPILQQKLEPVFPKDGAEFIQEVTGEVAVAAKGMAQVLHGDFVAARLAAGKELPGAAFRPYSQIAKAVSGSAPTAAWHGGLTARCSGCRSPTRWPRPQFWR